jgi:uncharacterized membrane protein
MIETMRLLKNLLIVLFVLGLIIFPLRISAQVAGETTFLEGEVVAILESGEELVNEELIDYQQLQIKITKGESPEDLVTVHHSEVSLGQKQAQFESYQVGDQVKLAGWSDSEGNWSYSIDGKVKRGGLIALTVLFVFVVVVVGRVWGVFSLLGLLTSFLVIFKLVIPLIIKGLNPVLTAILAAIIIVPISFYISHGFNKKTHVGVISTFISLIITGFLAKYFVDVVHLTGFASEEAGFLQVQRQGSIDLRGLLLAGIIIGTLGILDDVTIGQSSTVEQLKKANPKLSMMDLFKQGMRVGQDHISSMVNTLVLVYSGSALPLLLLFFDSQRTFIDIVESELIAEEIVRMLVGSIGLVLSAPLATILAAYWFCQESSTKNDDKSVSKSKIAHHH